MIMTIFLGKFTTNTRDSAEIDNVKRTSSKRKGVDDNEQVKITHNKL